MEKSLQKRVAVFCYLQGCFSEGALRPLHDPGHKRVLAHLKRLTLLGAAHSTQPGLKWQACNVFLHETQRLDQGFGKRNLFYPKHDFCVTISNNAPAGLLGVQFIETVLPCCHGV